MTTTIATERDRAMKFASELALIDGALARWALDHIDRRAATVEELKARLADAMAVARRL